jgi:hypothetical protein
LREVFTVEYPEGMIRYDRRYSERLLQYALSNLADYAARTADPAVAALSGRYHEIAAVHQRGEFYDDDLRAPIHGDYNSSNIHAHRGNAAQLKVVDWEWAGIGVPHADLAALIKSWADTITRPLCKSLCRKTGVSTPRSIDACSIGVSWSVAFSMPPSWPGSSWSARGAYPGCRPRSAGRRLTFSPQSNG